MNKLILIILFTFVSSISFSKEITLNCKFLNGQSESKSGVISREISSEYKQDKLFKFNEIPRYVWVDDVWFFSGSEEVSFSQDFIKIQKNEDGIFWHRFSLNRLTGDLFINLDFREGVGGNIYTKYKCSQIDKKLF